MKNKKVIYLNLFQFRFPVMAIASVLHRISGVFLALLVPVLLAVWQCSLTDAGAFTRLQQSLHGTPLAFGLWLFLSALFYHLAAGVRHLAMDMHFADSKAAGQRTAYAVIVIAVLFSIGLGVVLW